MQKVFIAALALLTTSVVLPPNILADSQIDRGGGSSSLCSADRYLFRYGL